MIHAARANQFARGVAYVGFCHVVVSFARQHDSKPGLGHGSVFTPYTRLIHLTDDYTQRLQNRIRHALFSHTQA